jgi:KUP system potassium uptake protein
VAQSQSVAKGADHGTPDGVANKQFLALVIGSIGVVYGDIGTSPLYALRVAVTAAKGTSFAGREVIYGVLSLITWALLLVVTLKYVIILLRADNKGEGGMFALMALGQSVARRSTPIIMALGIAGAAFFYGDAVITPAISVLSAVEGLKLISPAFERFVVPLSILILFTLFAVQSRGTAKVASFFGPLTVLWFLALAVAGLAQIAANPGVLVALNPWYGLRFLLNNGLVGLSVLGLVFLAITGAETLYADLGHFGRKPIQAAWFSVVLPALLLNYYGQGALLLARPEALANPFFLLYPEWALPFMVVLATVATVVAAQAVISGTFSLTRQAIQLGLLPRFGITHTSEAISGQIYLPRVNWMLLIAVVIVVLAFHSSSNLAAAYGVAVTAAMVITTLLAIFVVWRYWNWPLWQTAAVMIPLLFLEQIFLTANILKVFEGGWVPLVIAGCIALVMWTWVRGSRLLAKQTRKNEADLDWLLRKLEAKPPHRVAGTAVFFTADPTAAPTALMHNLKHNRVLHERNIILSIKTEDVPRVPRYERVTVDRVTDTFIRVVARYGFMETPSVPKILESCRRKDLNIDMSATSFFLSRRNLKPTPKSEMPGWQDRLFVALARSAQDATTYFQIPTDRVVEVGTQVAV